MRWKVLAVAPLCVVKAAPTASSAVDSELGAICLLAPVGDLEPVLLLAPSQTSAVSVIQIKLSSLHLGYLAKDIFSLLDKLSIREPVLNEFIHAKLLNELLFVGLESLELNRVLVVAAAVRLSQLSKPTVCARPRVRARKQVLHARAHVILIREALQKAVISSWDAPAAEARLLAPAT
mmetsp:Transcript_12214/g.16573  ORF Transcript_12214/g.16573 Transcript_12214/m.16573 type:complete len:178 (-) Transcript_12214:710-1243(-)